MAHPPRKPKESAPDSEEEATLWVHSPAQGVKAVSRPPPPVNPLAAPGSERTMILAPQASPPQAVAAPPDPLPHANWNPPTGPVAIPIQGGLTQMNQMTGPVPMMPGPPQPIRLFGPTDPRLVLLNEPDTDRAASYRLLRDTLLAKRLPRVFAISSAAKGEGKTTCACNISLALAERGARVMLLDANLWDPALHKIFSVEAAPPSQMNASWLAPYRIAELSRTLHVAGVVLPPGEPVPRFEKTWFESLVGALYRINYDFIVLDCPAMTVSPLISQLVGIAEGVLLAVKSGVTTARALRRAADQLAPGKGLGLALIDSTPNR